VWAEVEVAVLVPQDGRSSCALAAVVCTYWCAGMGTPDRVRRSQRRAGLDRAAARSTTRAPSTP